MAENLTAVMEMSGNWTKIGKVSGKRCWQRKLYIWGYAIV